MAQEQKAVAKAKSVKGTAANSRGRDRVKRASNESISVPELLARQSEANEFLFTIEALAAQTDRVKVTPFVSGAGCLCSRALSVPVKLISSITPTDEVHVCCGKKLMVVRVEFVDATLSDVFGQMNESIGQELQTRELNRERRARMPIPTRLRRAHSSGPILIQADPSQPWNEPLQPPEGGEGQQSASWRAFWCSREYDSCTHGCFEFYALQPDGYARCMCECENAYTRCLTPGAHVPPCV